MDNNGDCPGPEVLLILNVRPLQQGISEGSLSGVSIWNRGPESLQMGPRVLVLVQVIIRFVIRYFYFLEQSCGWCWCK